MTPKTCPKCKTAVVRREPTDMLRQWGGSCRCGKTRIDLHAEAQANGKSVRFGMGGGPATPVSN